jgi:hypothetical protein
MASTYFTYESFDINKFNYSTLPVISSNGCWYFIVYKDSNRGNKVVNINVYIDVN